MPIYIKTSGDNTTTGWNELTSIDGSSSEDVYVRVDSGSGPINRRVESVYVRTGTGWVEVFKAWVTPPPTAPSAVTLSSGANFNSNVYFLSVKWGASTPSAGSAISGYTLERKDAFGNLFTYYYDSNARDSGLISVDPGSTQKFRIKATASNSAGNADSAWSNTLQAKAGQENVVFSRSGVINHRFTRTPTGSCASVGVGDYYFVSKTGSGSDSAKPGYVNVTKAIYRLNVVTTNVGIASPTRSLICVGPGIYEVLSDPAYGNTNPVTIETSTYGALGGGEYSIQAVGTADGNGWPTHNTSTCQLNSNSLVYGNITISGVETTSNTVTSTSGTW